MFNLTVETAHTFYVGANGWLVHNCEWEIGKPINMPDEKGQFPNWSITKERYWKNKSAMEGHEFSPQNKALMSKGFAPKATVTVRNNKTGEIQIITVEKELHHIRGRTGYNPHDEQELLEVWP